MGTACRYCIASKGLRLGDKHIFDTEEEFINHIEMEHDIPVTRDGETEEQTKERFAKQNPRAGGPDCRCPSCLAKSDGRHALVDMLIDAKERG